MRREGMQVAGHVAHALTMRHQMNRFTTRVELHHADEDDYETLHEEMQRRGFTRTILSSDGVTYHLPPAEYDYRGDITGQRVLDLAQAAADATYCPSAILVTEARQRRWSGLSPD